MDQFSIVRATQFQNCNLNTLALWLIRFNAVLVKDLADDNPTGFRERALHQSNNFFARWQHRNPQIRSGSGNHSRTVPTPGFRRDRRPAKTAPS